jgi:hypothetical protein
MISPIACYASLLVLGILLIVVGRRRGEDWERIALSVASFVLVPGLAALVWFLPGSRRFVQGALLVGAGFAVMMIFVRMRLRRRQ